MRWLDRLLGRSRRRAPESYPVGPVRDLALSRPPGSDTPLADVSFLALDLETTGLDASRDHIVSAGWLRVDRLEVLLASAEHVFVRPPADVGTSATIHGITDDAVAASPRLREVLPDLLAAMGSRVLVCHHAPMEVGFLNRAANSIWGSDLPITVVDTLALERSLTRHDEQAPHVSLRLAQCRRRYGLPEYAAHSALTDALASAELLLAQIAELERRRKRPLTLADLDPTTS